MKSNISLGDMTMDQLLDLQQKIDARIAEIATAEMDELNAKMEKLKPYVGGRKTKSSGRSKAAPKYEDPKTGKTWSGRGMTPVWLREYEEAGKNRESFRIKS